MLEGAGRAGALDRKALDERSRNFLKPLITHDIDLVPDVGANTGDWAKLLFETGYEGLNSDKIVLAILKIIN